MFRLVPLLALLSAASLDAQVSEGDRRYSRRAEGQQAGRANPVQIDAAIAAYQRAVALNANDLEARWKLTRALWFKGAYVAASKDAKRKMFDEAKSAGGSALGIVERMLVARGLASPSRASEKRVAEMIRTIPGAAEVYFWDAVAWGEWAQVYGKMAAVKEGVADRLKRESTIVMLSDPKVEGGGGARVLGRLHDQTPRVPFLTGWASSVSAVKYLRQSLAQDPANKITRVFLAEAMVANDKRTKAEAVRILKEVIASPNDRAYSVEDANAQSDARHLLRSWGVR